MKKVRFIMDKYTYLIDHVGPSATVFPRSHIELPKEQVTQLFRDYYGVKSASLSDTRPSEIKITYLKDG